MNDVGDADDINYYKQIFEYVSTKGGKALVVENPGHSFPESMVNCADTFMAFESFSSNYAGYDPSWQMNYPAARFWHAIHTCPEDQMPTMIQLSRTKNAGYVYVTDKDLELEDVWLHIASNFADEITEVSNGNLTPVIEQQVPLVQGLRPAAAASKLRAAGLEAEFEGLQGPNSSVSTQSPTAGTRVTPGSKVTLQLGNGPIN